MSLISVIEKSAPIIANILGGPFAGTAISLLESAFGVKSDQLENVIANDPDAAIKLKKIEIDHKEALAKLSVEDVESAREREIKITELTGKRDWIIPALAFSFVAIYAVIQMWAIYSPSNQDDIISARLQDIILMIASYFFGKYHETK